MREQTIWEMVEVKRASLVRYAGRFDGYHAVAASVHSADIVINILARHREPAAPITIMTPDALRLLHAGVADCTRYGSLRRASDGAIRDPDRHERSEALRHEGGL